MDAPATLPALLDELATSFGPREALVSRRRRMSYAELGDDSKAIAASLAARGVGKGTRVGLLMPNWPEWIAAAFAVWRCGGILVPLNTLSRPRELAYCLRHADVTLLIAVKRFLRHDYRAALEEIAPGVSRAVAPIHHPDLPALFDTVWLDPPPDAQPVDCGPLIAGGDRLDPSWLGVLTDRVSPADSATIVFTSGTTSEPKGVVHEHQALCRATDDVATVLGLEPDDRTWAYLPFFFTGGLVAVALATLARGATVVLQEIFEPGETLRLLEAERCTVFFAWPHQAEALIAHPRFREARLHLRKGVGANAKWAETLYPPNHHAVGTYGMTETSPLCTAWPWDAPLALRRASHGAPVRGRELRICDPETGALLPQGQAGEICVRGPTLFSHYYGHEPSACFDAEGFFHTGDLGRLDEGGALHFLGRIKDVIKTAGVNVAAAEVEATLLTHPSVGAAYVVGVPAGMRGENVAAFVVLEHSVALEHAVALERSVTAEAEAPALLEELLAHCRAKLASYKVPRHIWFRKEGELPVKGTGKVDKQLLRTEAAQLVHSLLDPARNERGEG